MIPIRHLLTILTLATSATLSATCLKSVSAIDNEHILLHFRDGEVRYRDNATGPSAYLGHSFAPGDDTLKVFGNRLDTHNLHTPSIWTITSADDNRFPSTAHPLSYGANPNP